MAKPMRDKYDISDHRLGDIVGILDFNDEGVLGVFTDGEFHSLEEITTNALGAKVAIQFDNPIESGGFE